MTSPGTPPSAEWAPYLDPDERILWQGRPDPQMSLRGAESATLLIGLVILGFISWFMVEFWMYHDGPVWGDSTPFGLVLWVIIGVCVGLTGPVGMKIVRRGTWYTLTDRRAIIAHWPQVFGYTIYRGLDCYPVHAVEVVPSDLRGLQTVNFAWLSERATYDDGWRDVRLPRLNARDKRSVRDHRVGFERLADAEDVAALCRKVEAAGLAARSDP